MQSDTLSPFVYWGQTADSITLRIDLKNSKKPTITLEEDSLNFFVVGVGAKGLNEYSFFIEFYSQVLPEKSFYKLSERNIEFVLKKKTLLLWPRLLNTALKPQWIKVDFDRVQQSSSSDASEDEARSLRNANSRHAKDKNFGRGRKNNKTQDFKTTYLFLYNLLQFVGYTYTFIIFLIHYVKEGSETVHTIYPSLRHPIKFVYLMQLLEVLHPLVGLTVGKANWSLLRLTSRFFFIFLLIDRQVAIQSHYATFYLFLVYTMIELVRYPYYMLHIHKVHIAFITWTRYTAQLVLYPLAVIFEAIIVFNSITLLEESRQLSIFLPNNWNISFYMPTFLRLYLNLLCVPLFTFFYMRIYQHRKQKVLSCFKKKIH